MIIQRYNLTIVTGMVLILGAATASGQGFKREVADIFAEVTAEEPTVVSEADLVGLPESVQRYLRYTGVVGQPRIQAVRLKQRGDMRRAPDKPWMPMKAVEYYTTNPPAFIWKGDFKAAPLFKITALDRYRHGRGNMRIKLLGLFKVADLRAPELDHATLIRFFSEGIWFPTVFLEDYVTWEAVDSLSAKVTMTYEGVTASGVFTFNELGQAVNFETERYMEKEGTFELKPWSTPIEGYREMNGMMIPSSGEAVWHLEDGEFPYWRGEIFDLEYNQPSAY
ncbi:MAG: hypothetical protein JSU77_04340 [Fidelibacterota bacterium]|nr:MAG: hypothetical protein JSU77_04340 [Candidatus Neomarinimicrobiota bacterium]